MSRRYRLAPTPQQALGLQMHCDHARAVWNTALEHFGYSTKGRRCDIASWDRLLTEARTEFGWLREGSSSVQQGALRDLRQALRNWWGNPSHFGRPTWRSRHGKQGFVVRDLSVRTLSGRWAEIQVPKVGWVRFRLSRALPEGAKSARITLDRAGRWHVSIVARPEERAVAGTGAVVGLDMGVSHTVTTSDGQHLDMPELLSPGEVQRLRRLERKKARQRKGSNRRAETKRKISVLRARQADRRKDWVEKTTTDLARTYDLVVLEDLRIRNMMRSAKGTVEAPGKNVRQKAGLNRSIAASAWSMLRTRVEQKMLQRVVAVDPRHTSQRCAACGHVASENRESQAVFRCVACGHEANADVNAALNILAAGLAVAGRGGTPHQRPGEASTSEAA